MCGYNPSAVQAKVERVDYGNDTVAASPKSILNQKYEVQSVGNQVYAYVAGGLNNLGSETSDTRRVDYLSLIHI